MSTVDRPHLRDLYGEGEEIIIKVWNADELQEVPVWLRRPNPIDQQESQRKGRAARARVKMRLSEGDERMSLEQEIDVLDKSEVCDQLIQFSSTEFDSQAQNDVLYDEKVGSNWSDEKKDEKDGLDLHGVSEAFQTRWNEIVEMNEEREIEEQSLVKTEDDKELQTLQAVIDRFEKEVMDRGQELKDGEMKDLMKLKRSSLGKQLLERNIDVEADLEFYQEYQLAMLFYACRMPDDHTKPYFQSPREILEFPTMVRTQLSTAYEAMEMGVENIKNWLSLLSSSDSSE